MLYLHFCHPCERIHILSGHRLRCPACDGKLTELSVTYESYIRLSRNERLELQRQCGDPTALQKMQTLYTSRYKRK